MVHGHAERFASDWGDAMIREEIFLNRKVNSDPMPQPWNRLPVGMRRAETYAENMIGEGNYKDSGCNLAPACLTCPFSECMKEYTRQDYREERNARMWADYKRMKKRGVKSPIEAIAEKYDLSWRACYRIINNAKAGKGYAKNLNRPKQKVDTHTLLTAGIYKKRVPPKPLPVSY